MFDVPMCAQMEEAEDLVPSKLLNLEDAGVVGSGVAAVLLSQPPKAESPQLRPPLLTSLKFLFNYFSFITEHTAYISQQTHFVFKLIQLIVVCGQEQARPLLQHMPTSLVSLSVFIYRILYKYI